MIVLDTSVIVAIAQGEPEAPRFAATITDAGQSVLAAPSYVECALVLEGRYGAAGHAFFGAVLQRLTEAHMIIVDFDAAHARIAREAFRTFGRGRHPAGLNFGDCLVYATAKALDAPLLFKGDDFALTDIMRA
ncbi:MAG: type II toxin-antitoxin system VapC family toxin [Hyphomonadaceae bacterium]|nr:MAG: hypothetical protein FD160_1864 [Caulobacteraceae bacterium]MBT9445508.1 type II toxin-antitoxin system VapC family toxin [Hyphomonadaceae bacterium]TPW04196.1 MAG: hypothetical protein FD124_2714 [Alphaproteobacteria bacterium]